MENIKIQGARVHNLKEIDLTIPKHQLVVITGISGSGKSSLAFDILFEEGKNQYLRSIGILAGMDNEDRFETLQGIGPTVAVCQNTIRQSNPRSTVGSKTSLLNELALIFASEGKNEANEQLSPSHFLYTTADGMCVDCGGKGYEYEIDLEYLIPDRTTKLLEVYEKLKVTSGFLRILRKKYGTYFNTPFWQLPEEIQDEVVYGKYENGKQSYCIERILRNAYEKGEDVERVYTKVVCPECRGERIGDEAREVLLQGKTIGELANMTITALRNELRKMLTQDFSQFSKNVLKHMLQKLDQLIAFRLGHLSLYREISSLSGGEVQRLFLHMHLESGLDSLIYVFDEPMAGLHPSEKESVIKAVKKLRDIGNTVIVVEHDKEILAHADHIIEIGPKAGAQGGEVVYEGSYEDYKQAGTLLSKYFFEKTMLPIRQKRKVSLDEQDSLMVEHAKTHYLKDLTVTFPLHAMVGIAGLSGSGKSSLIEETLIKRLVSAKKYGYAMGLKGADHIAGVVKISQEPIGRSASSTPASYIGIWDKIRELFAKQPVAIQKGMVAGHFSFNSKGACPDCGGSGFEKIFLTANFSVDKICPSCRGKRFDEESLRVTYKGKNIADILEMSISEATSFFEDQSQIVKSLEVLQNMGMGYLKLGQPTSSLSGGERQRVKLAKELGQKRGGNMLYILDEPTTGLSLYDTALLLKLLDQLVEGHNSVIVIEHHLEVLNNCDYIIELGPEGGEKGGEIIAKGTPKQISKQSTSKTGRYLVCS